jgi:hypothetical protein
MIAGEVSPDRSDGRSATLGIDLASQPARTAACRIDWNVGQGQVRLYDGEELTDARLIELIRDETVTKVGIDAPFGWPDPFVEAISKYQASSGQWPISLDAYDDQRALVLRETDRMVATVTGRQPLSVSTDRIAFAAMRCARLLSALAEPGAPIDRGGAGRLVEVYPEAALRCWQISPALDLDDPGGYKGRGVEASARRATLLSALRQRTADWLLIPDEVIGLCRASDDQLDALLCALIARTAERGLCASSPSEHSGQAAREGWIMLPEGRSLSAGLL